MDSPVVPPDSIPSTPSANTTVGEEPVVVKHEGYLFKRSMYTRRWVKRWFELDNKGTLSYKIDKADEGFRNRHHLGRESYVGLLPPLPSRKGWELFYIHGTGDDSVALASDSLMDAQIWVSVIAEALNRPTTHVNREPKATTPSEVGGRAVEETNGRPRAISGRPRLASFLSPANLLRARSKSVGEQQHREAEEEETSIEEQYLLLSSMIDDVLTKKDNECASRVEAAEREGQAAIARLEAMLAAEEVAASRAHEAAESLERNLCRLQSKHDALQQAFADVKQQLADEVVGREQTEDTLEAVTEELERRTRAHSQLDVEFHKLTIF